MSSEAADPSDPTRMSGAEETVAPRARRLVGFAHLDGDDAHDGSDATEHHKKATKKKKSDKKGHKSRKAKGAVEAESESENACGVASLPVTESTTATMQPQDVLPPLPVFSSRTNTPDDNPRRRQIRPSEEPPAVAATPWTET